jgi:hypothetical protein
VIGVAGDDDLTLPVDGGQESVAARLESAVAGATTPDGEPPSPPDGADDGTDPEAEPADTSNDAVEDAPRTVEDVLGTAATDGDAVDETGATATADPPPSDDEPK